MVLSPTLLEAPYLIEVPLWINWSSPWCRGSAWDCCLLDCELNWAPVQDGSMFHIIFIVSVSTQTSLTSLFTKVN